MAKLTRRSEWVLPERLVYHCTEGPCRAAGGDEAACLLLDAQPETPARSGTETSSASRDQRPGVQIYSQLFR